MRPVRHWIASPSVPDCCFQVVDDILDCTASTATLSKTAGKDAAAEKPTYVTLMGLESAREFADDLCTQTLESLAILANAASA